MFDSGKTALRVVGIDIGKDSFHVVGLDRRGAIVLRQRWSRGQVDVRFANLPRCLIGMEACATAHYWARELQAVGHGGPAEHAVCGDQDSPAASRPAAAPWPGKAGSAAHRPSQLS